MENKDRDYQIAMLEHRIDWFEKKYGPYIEKRGLKNWKNLFRKPTLHEWIILVMLMMAMFLGWAYAEDTKLCKETLENIDVICASLNDFVVAEENNFPNISEVILNGTGMTEFSSENG